MGHHQKIPLRLRPSALSSTPLLPSQLLYMPPWIRQRIPCPHCYQRGAPSGPLLGLTAESQALDAGNNEAWGGGVEGVCQTLQQGDHPSLNKQPVTPFPPTPSPLNNLDLLPSCLQATPLRLPRMSHSDRAIYEDAAGEVGAGVGRGQGSYRGLTQQLPRDFMWQAPVPQERSSRADPAPDQWAAGSA